MAKAKKNYPIIHIAQGCVFKGDQVLLIRRNEPELKNLHMNLELPGGKIEIGETPEQAAIREIKEETGVIAKIDYPIPFSFERERKEKKIIVNINCFKCDFVEQTQKRPQEIKVKDAAWYNLRDFSPIYMQTGSLMFLLYGIEKSKIPVENPILTNIIAQIELRCINPSANNYKMYKLIIKSTYRQDVAFEVITIRGSIRFSHAKKDERYISFIFKNKDDMNKYIEENLKKRYKHEYKIFKADDHFPKLDILAKFQSMDDHEQQLTLDL